MGIGLATLPLVAWRDSRLWIYKTRILEASRSQKYIDFLSFSTSGRSGTAKQVIWRPQSSKASVILLFFGHRAHTNIQAAPMSAFLERSLQIPAPQERPLPWSSDGVAPQSLPAPTIGGALAPQARHIRHTTVSSGFALKSRVASAECAKL